MYGLVIFFSAGRARASRRNVAVLVSVQRALVLRQKCESFATHDVHVWVFSASNTPDQDMSSCELPKRLRRCSKCLVHAETRSLRERLLSSISNCFVMFGLVFRTNIAFRTDPPARNVSSAKYRSAACKGIPCVTKGYVEGGCHSTVSPTYE